jgi:hypothetical protein
MQEETGRTFLSGLKKPNLSRKLYIIAAAIVIILVVLAVSVALILLPANQNNDTIAIDQAACRSAGGAWNECGSLCQGQPPGTMCPAVCVQQCEWYASSAEAVRSRHDFSSQQGFTCITQQNGILLCWLRANTSQSGLTPV